MAVAVEKTDEVIPAQHRMVAALPMTIVIYSADRGVLVSGYQFSVWSLVAVPGDALWLT